MKRRIFSLLAVSALLVAVCSGCRATAKPTEEFETKAYWAHGAQEPETLDFYIRSGYNTVAYCDVSWYYRPGSSAFAAYQQKLAANITLAHQKGLRVHMVLLSNLEQWTGTDAEFGNGMGKMFDPADTEKMNERLGYLRQVVGAFAECDSFSLFAGDPGGVLGLDAEGGLEYYIQMARDVRDIVREEAPEAKFNVNLWAVSQFIQAEADPWKVDFWVAEDKNSRAIIAAENLLGPDVGIELVGHDYYRTLALSLYGTTGVKPETPFPVLADTQAILDKGVTRCWAFAHSIIPDITAGVQFNMVRIKYYIDQMRQAGLNGVVCGSAYFPSQYADVYAFGRFAADKDVTVEQVLREYAGYLTADDASAAALWEIFRYLNKTDAENLNLSEEYALPPMETTLTDPWQAEALLDTVTPATTSDFPLPESAADYLARIREKLQYLQSITRPTDAPVTGAMLCDFRTNRAGLPAATVPGEDEVVSNFLLPSLQEYTLAAGTYDPVDAGEYAGYGYLQFDIYSEEARRPRGYVMLGNDINTLGVNRFWQYDYGGALVLQAGWNHVCVRLSLGSCYGTDEVDWSNLQAMRMLFYTDPEDTYRLYVKDLYISSDANYHP